MASVKLPDGSVINNIPDDMPPAEVSKLAAAHWQKVKPDPYADKSLDDIKQMYRQSSLVGADDKTRARISDAYVRKEYDQSSELGKVGSNVSDVVRTAARGVPVLGGALDEISAGVNSVMPEALGGASYGETLDYQRARDRAADAMPGSTAVQVGGGVAGTMAGARALGLGYWAGSNTPLLQRALAGGAVGAPVVGADSFTRGEGGPRVRGEQAAVGAALGVPLGAAAPVVAQGAASLLSKFAGMLTSEAMLRKLGISRNTADVLLRQLQSDDTLTGRGAARIRHGGPDAMLADAGPAATNLLDTALERSGPGATAARNAIEQRATQANSDLRGAMDQTFGGAVGVETRQAGIRQGTAAARDAAYKTAYGTPIDYADQKWPELWKYLVGRVPESAITQANKLLRAEGAPLIEYTAGKNGTITFKQLPNVQQLDYVTRGLNDVARQGETAGALGRGTNESRIYENLSGDIRTRLGNLVSAYGDALDTASDPIRRIQATEFGATILNKTTTREQVAERLAGMDKGERRATIQGLRDQVDEIAANVRAMASDPNIDARQLKEVLGGLSSQAAGEKIATILGGPATRAFMGQVKQAMRAMELRASVARNSRTFGRTSTDTQVKAQLDPSVVGLAMEGEIPKAMRKAVQWFTGMSPERRLAAEDHLYGEIASALTKVRGRAAERYLKQLERALRSRGTNTKAGKAVGNLGADVYVGATVNPASGFAGLLRPSQP